LKKRAEHSPLEAEGGGRRELAQCIHIKINKIYYSLFYLKKKRKFRK
jgi:hypothetical protein